jgi:hypothetical protein
VTARTLGDMYRRFEETRCILLLLILKMNSTVSSRMLVPVCRSQSHTRRQESQCLATCELPIAKYLFYFWVIVKDVQLKPIISALNKFAYIFYLLIFHKYRNV